MQNYNCKNCGAVLYWDAKEECLKCEFCDSKYQPSDFEDYTNTTEEVKNEESQKEYTNSEPAEDMSVYECKNCGGEIVTLKTTMATICPYCGEAVSITSKSVGEFRPKLCIPFKNDKNEIIKLYKNYVNSSFLTPKVFKEESTVEKIQGLFTPFYLHTIDEHTTHHFEGDKITSSRRGNDKVTTHNIYDIIVDADANFKKIPTDASKRIDDEMMEAIEPFDYNGIKEYNPAYMAGFAAEQADVEKSELENRAKKRSKDAMYEKARGSLVGYSSLVLKSDNSNINNHESDYAMLPVWLLNVKYKEKKYVFAINGQNGKVVGKLPKDKLKLFLIGAGSFLASNIVISIVSMFFR